MDSISADPPLAGSKSALAPLAWLEQLMTDLDRLIKHRVRELEQGKAPQPLDALWQSKAAGELENLTGLRPLHPPESLALVLSLLPDFHPHLLHESIGGALKSAGDHPRLGGVRGSGSRVLFPTGETYLFLAGAGSMAERVSLAGVFDHDHRLVNGRWLRLEEAPTGEPEWAGALKAGRDLVDRLASGKRRRPKSGPDFPADRIETDLDWDDLVLEPGTLEQIRELESWVRHGQTLLNDWGLRKRMRPGYRALFFGPPGTGKTLTASLLGRYTGRDVYRIDLSLVVSKFIGETEKNLARVFAHAEDQDWILFFDEADALFGKRTQVKDAHDRYANQEVAYLLQRVENFEGLVILASNFRNNIDDAFLRRFQSVIHFPKPTPEQRLRIFRTMLPGKARLEDRVNLQAICQKHELTGANIANVIQYACLRSIDRGETELKLADLQTAIQREYQKEGRLA